MSLWNRLISAFGYDAAETSPRRKTPSAVQQSEDSELTAAKRQKLLATTRDIQRNFALAGWMIRRHLDYVSTFSFQANTGDDALDTQIESFVNWWAKPENCDIAGRHSLPRMIRLAEARSTVDHDVGLLKIADGHLQGVEGDRIKTPSGGVGNLKESDFVQGVYTDKAGKAISYAICQREGSSLKFERLVPASNLYLHGNFDRFDQIRGISPLAAALNTLVDVKDGFDYALAKLKVSQLFGLAFYRNAGEGGGLGAVSGDEESGYEVDLSKGHMILDLDPGDRAEFLESKTPSTEFQAFTQAMISVALKSLDIPYSFYAENFTNYSGARQALLQYEQSADQKRGNVRALLDHITKWRLALAIQDGQLPMFDLEVAPWLWVPRGLPWIDPAKEIAAERDAIDAGLDNPEDICQRHGKNFYENIDKIKRCREYAVLQGVELMVANKPPVQEPVKDESQPQQAA